jgi:hypothetical protein
LRRFALEKGSAVEVQCVIAVVPESQRLES